MGTNEHRYRYSAGDKVIVNVTQEWLNQHGIGVQRRRLDLNGKIVTIIATFLPVYAYDCHWCYLIDADYNGGWCDELLLPFIEEPIKVCGSLYG